MITFKIVPDIRKGPGGLLCPRGPLSHTAGVAQLVEHLICNQRVRGSNPFASSRKYPETQGQGGGITDFPTALHKEIFPSEVFACERISARIQFFYFFAAASVNTRLRAKEELAVGVSAQVGEWLKPADCKSAPPCEVRRFESSPVHHSFE